MIQTARLLKVGQKFKILSCNQILQIIPLYIVQKIFGYTQDNNIMQIFYNYFKSLKFMSELKIESNNGFLQMEDLPQNCIFNKVVTGCGGTTIALFNNKN